MSTFVSFDYAATFNWDRLIPYILTYELPFLRKHSKSYIFQNAFCDQWGNTSLHQACYNKPPLEAMNALLSHENLVQLCAKRARDGSTPFLVACACQSSFNVLLCMIEKVYSAKNWPPKYRVNRIESREPRYMFKVNAMDEEEDVDRNLHISPNLKFIATAYDKLQVHPVSAIWKAFQKTKTFNSFAINHISANECRSSLEFHDFLNKLKLVIYAEYSGQIWNSDKDSVPKGMLHVLARRIHDKNLFFLLLPLCKDYLYVRDFQGNLPLHLLASSTAGGFDFLEITELFLLESPDSAAIANNLGQLALHLSLMNGNQWDDVKNLVFAEPSTLTKREPVTKMLPFMLAASNQNEMDQNHDQGDSLRVSTIYQLLLANPAAIETAAIESSCHFLS